MAETSERELIAAVQAGNTAAFDELVLRHHRALYYFVAGRHSPHSEAEEIVQKAFITAFTQLNRFNTTEDFRSWLRGIALNHCRDCWKSHLRRSRMKNRVLETRRAELRLALLDQPAEDNELALKALSLCLQSLPDSDRSLVKMRFAEGLPINSIATSLSRESGGLRFYLYRLRDRLVHCVRKRLSLQEGAGAR